MIKPARRGSLETSQIGFPFWLVWERPDVDAPLSGSADERFAVAFSDTRRAMNFRRRHRDGRWSFRLVSWSSLTQDITELHAAGYSGIHLDPQADAQDGEEISLAELWSICRAG